MSIKIFSLGCFGLIKVFFTFLLTSYFIMIKLDQTLAKGILNAPKLIKTHPHQEDTMNQLAGNPVKPERQLQIPEQIAHLEISLNVLHNNIQSLKERIGSILREPEPLKQTEPEDAQLVVHAGWLRESRREIDRANYDLIDILERLEI